MDDETRVRVMLRDTAEHGPVMVPVEKLLRRARRRRRVWQAATASGTAAVVALAVLVPLALRGAPIPRAVPLTPQQKTTAGDLARYRWSAIPAAPIAGRVEAAAAWDGREMLVWGGTDETGQRSYGDGAAYNPSTRTWRLLPPAPIVARSYPASAWTGRYLFIWGGAAAGGLRSDGALFDPATWTWHVLPQAPLPAGAGTAVWTGSRVLVLNGTSSATYDPTSNAWHLLPVLSLPGGWSPAPGTMVAAGGEVYLFSQGSNGSRAGLFVLRYTPDGWVLVRTAGHGPFVNVGEAQWTGEYVIAPAAQQCPANWSCPYMASGQHGYLLNTATATWSAMSPGPLDALNAGSLWTGGALLDLNAQQGPQLGGRVTFTTVPGAAAVWNPVTGKWTRLASSPYTASGIAMVWTGDRVLEWGLMFRGTQTQAHAVGQQFGSR